MIKKRNSVQSVANYKYLALFKLDYINTDTIDWKMNCFQQNYLFVQQLN